MRKYVIFTKLITFTFQCTDSFMLDTGDGQAMALPVDDAWSEQSLFIFDFHI